MQTASPAQILAVLQEMARHQAVLDPEADGIDLTQQTAVAEWREACDLLPWRELYPALERWFGVSLPDSAWERALEPASRRTLEDVCSLLASCATTPTIQPWQGSSEAGAFLALRALLRHAGLPARELAPRTALHPWMQSHPAEILIAAARLAPGRLPIVTVSGWWRPVARLPGLVTFKDLARLLASQ